MTLSEAIKKRILGFVETKKETITSFCLNSDITPSTIFDFLYGKTKLLKIDTINKICIYMEIYLKDFFDTEYFKF